ncbi:putative deoxyribonuclease RhsA [compost metagenome]
MPPLRTKTGSANVFTNGKPAARAHVDTATCDQHGSAPQILAQGSDSVYINGLPAARVGDKTVCDAKISAGSGNVFIGGGTETTDAISPEVPAWLERAVLVVGLASAFVLASPVIVVAGLVGGVAGGLGGNWAGGKLYGEGSDEQKLMAFGGALLGGGLGAKGGKWFDARYEIKVQGLGSNLGNISITKRNKLAKAGEDLYVGTYNQVRGGNIKGGLNATHTPHHVIQNAVSPTTHGKGVTINLRKDLHELTWTYKKPLMKGLTERQYLARDAADVRGILKNAGYSRQIVNRQVGELIKQNKELWKTLGQ